MNKNKILTIIILIFLSLFVYYLFFYNENNKLVDEYGEPIKIRILNSKELINFFSLETTIDAKVFRTKDKLYFRIKRKNKLLNNINEVDKVLINGVNRDVKIIYLNYYYSLCSVDISEYSLKEKISFTIYNNGLYYKNSI